ncbi:hypothetical protein SAMN05216223_117144 [Actinacidiphila yanglinensis]|uniref:Uncharacterized protein n=2 Tax=Actinacidiphila yanglinensis TaxID=310779 RepID=A0A1H6DMQ8_9ACTN|nr:hypothetical protein SAMN05216223_117144 [Actinacidiphila yanglinensis]
MEGRSYPGGGTVAPRPPEAAAPVRPEQVGAAGTAPGGVGTGAEPGGAAPTQWHRGMTVIATVSLFIGTRGSWTNAMAVHPWIAGIISVCYAAILVAGVLACTVRGRRALTRVDAGVLATALLLMACRYALHHAGVDEGVLTAQAATAIDHGRPIYDQPWPWLFHGTGIGITKTMGGGADYTYGYPPLAPLLTAPVHLLVHSTAAATMVSTGALAAGTVLLWLLLPAPWRSAATAVCLGFDLLPQYAREGYPAMLAFALLVPVVVRWTDTGAGGRLGRYGVLRAVCLGAACASQQLAWFFTPFLLVALYAVRRGELGARGPRGALAVTARYTGIALASWGVLNAYFAAQDPRGWLHGILLPLTQKAIMHGQGVVDISNYFTDGSSRLDFYSYGSSLLLLGLLAATCLFVRRLGPAITILPWASFYFATRSQDGYFLMLTPLWLAALATVPGSAFARAWQPRLPARLRGRRAKAAVAAGLLAPAVLCVSVAAASSPPLTMKVTPKMALAHHGFVSVTVRVTNNASTALTPHFASRNGQGSSDWWTIESGARTLRPHASATYRLTPPGGYREFPPHSPLYLTAFTDNPMTITSSLISSKGAPPRGAQPGPPEDGGASPQARSNP